MAWANAIANDQCSPSSAEGLRVCNIDPRVYTEAQMVARLSCKERDAIATRLTEIDAELLILHTRADTQNNELALQWGQLYREMYTLEQLIGGTSGQPQDTRRVVAGAGSLAHPPI